MEIRKLKEYIGQRLLNLSGMSVYDKKAKSKATFPYIVFKLNTCNYLVRERKDWILELDFWQDSNDDEAILEASENVKNGTEEYVGLNNSTQVESEGFYICNIDFEGEVDEPEQNISRYNQRYILRVD